MDILIKKEHDGTVLREFLLGEVGISVAMLKHLKFLPDGILVNGKHVTVRHILCEGETLFVKCEDDEPSENIVPSDIKVEIAYEDDDIVVADKLPFMPTHPSHGHFNDTLANALCFRYMGEKSPFVFRSVNRLDRNTSGLVLVARTRMAAARLSSEMSRGGIKKEYVAILSGVLPENEGEIDTYIRRESESIITRCVCGEGEGGDRALTRYRVLFCDGNHTVVLAAPITGRTHQLRLHFAHLGAPIIGDDMYGEVSEHIKRHALHARKLTFTHPSDNREMELVSSLPDDMERLIDRIFLGNDREKAREALRQ